MKKTSSIIFKTLALLCFSGAIVSCGSGNIIQSEDKNIKSITVKEGTIPEEIFIGEFDQAGIKLLISYTDGTEEEVPVTTQMIPEQHRYCLEQPGVYTINILFNGTTVPITIKIVVPHYMVNFYAYVDEPTYELVASHDAMIHSNIDAPDVVQDFYYEDLHYYFNGWDKTFFDITESIDVYAQYNTIEFYTVTFYNGSREVISTQKIDKNEDAVEPNEEMRFVDGYDFIGWDRSYLDVTQNLDIYGVYVTVSKTGEVNSPFIYQEDEITESFYNLGLNAKQDGYIIYSCIKTEEHMIVPSFYKNLPIVEINQHTFLDAAAIKDVEIGYNLKTIRNSVFENCTSLESVVIPNSVTTFESYVFENCTALSNLAEYDNALYLGNEINPYLILYKAKDLSITSCDINHGCRFVNSRAFLSTALTSLIVPDNVTYMGHYSLAYCQSLEYVVLSNGMNYLEEVLFYCSGGKAKTVVLPENLESIREHAFYWGNVSSITFPKTLKNIYGASFQYNESLTEIDLPEGLVGVYQNAFADCDALANVSLPSTIQFIGKNAFNNCPMISSFVYNGTVEDWNNVYLEEEWNGNCPATSIICTDGVIDL